MAVPHDYLERVCRSLMRLIIEFDRVTPGFPMSPASIIVALDKLFDVGAQVCRGKVEMSPFAWLSKECVLWRLPVQRRRARSLLKNAQT